MIDKIIESAKMAESYKELFDLIDAIPPEGASVVARRCWGGAGGDKWENLSNLNAYVVASEVDRANNYVSINTTRELTNDEQLLRQFANSPRPFWGAKEKFTEALKK